MGLRTNFYVDGFNLYYGLLKGEPGRKWLDLMLLAQTVRKRDHINRVRYFTALVTPWPQDPHEPQRQLTYLRALKTLPNVDLHLGQYQLNSVRRMLVKPQPGQPLFLEVYDSKEKGSDVNLATMLLCDATDREFEQAIVVSNDSDLALPIEKVRTKFGLKIGVLSPRPKVTARLRLAASFCGALRGGAIEASQFPNVMQDAHGTITKPEHW